MGRKPVIRPTADEALEILLKGNKRFVTGKLEHPNHCEESRHAVADRQEPIATILTCADSRVPPVDIFDQGIGDIAKAGKVKVLPAYYDHKTGEATLLEI